ncbi:MAG: DAK2 domain-containing protein, partial [Treponema sp.]|nr:DAK2 domain-containing protein [Treponema sp.]
MNTATLRPAMETVNKLMAANRDYLVELDQQNGDGDLGISMAAGFKALSDYLAAAEEKDLGRVFMKCGGVFNEAAPSSLGTIISFGFMGMAKALKGKEDAGAAELAAAMEAGL